MRSAASIAQHLQSRLGQNIIIENRPGGGTTIGAKAVAAAPAGRLHAAPRRPESRVLPGAVSQSRLRSGQGSRCRSRLSVTWSHVIAVAPSVPAKTIAELVAYAKANPGKLAFGYRPRAPCRTSSARSFKQADRHRHHRRSLSRRRAGARRSAGRPRPHQHRAGAATAAADPRRQDPGARLHRAAAQPGPAGRSHHDRKRLSAGRLQSGCLDGNLRAGRHPARHRRQAQSRSERRRSNPPRWRRRSSASATRRRSRRRRSSRHFSQPSCGNGRRC